MRRSQISIVLACVLALVAPVACQAPPHVLELHHNAETATEDVVKVFLNFGVTKEQVTPLVQKVADEGKAVVIAGTKESCESAAALFGELNMKTVVRPLDKDKDLPQKQGGNKPEQSAATGAGAGAAPPPGEYAGTDVIEANTAMLKQFMADKSAGTLVVFSAPWCGHCRQMAPNVKQAATMLKAKGIKTAAINSDNEPGLAQSLGIRGFPSVKWAYNGELADYKGDRSAMDLVNFATTQNALSAIKGKVADVVTGVKKVGKLAMSKVLAHAGMQPAQAPAGAAGAA